MRTSLLFSFLLGFSITAGAQQFGGHPPAQKWKQINTDTARIIFQPGLDSQASRVASIVHHLAANQPVSLGDKLKKINIVLQNHTVLANGYVGLGPYRSEFYLTPPMNNFQEGSIGWTDQLGVHEYRHVQQFNNFNNGLSHVAKILFGEEGYAVAINASVPNWFYEGDAVYHETVLSNQGRGRLPQFLNAYPALWQAGKKYSWMKLRNGSMKDYVPNHYNLGYLLVNYGREKYGADFWTKVTRDATAFKGLFYPFQAAVKRHSGADYKTFTGDAFDSYKNKTERVSYTRDEFVFPVNKNYVTSYFFPYAAGNDSLIYLKSSYRQRPAFYIKDKSGEHKIRIMDISTDEQFSYRNGKIVYTAYERDARWRWRDYSVIKLLDINTGLQQTLTQKSKYFTPDISADGSKVAAVQVDANGHAELHILSTASGELLQTIRSAEIGLFTDPKFIDDDNLVTAVRLRDGKMALALAEIKTGNTMRLTPPSFSVVGYPCVSDGVVYFTASYGGNDDIYALRMNDRKIYRLSGGGLGKYFVNAGNGKLTWSVFTAEGYQLKQTAEKDIEWTEVSAATAETLREKFPVSPGKDNGDILLGKMQPRNFAAVDYKKGTKLFNFHSWRPYYEDPILTYSLYGQNILNTMETEIFYSYNQNEKTSSAGINAVYGGLFPYLNLGTELTFDRQATSGNQVRTWNQLDSRVGLSVPLVTVKGRSFRNFNISSFYVLRNDMYKGPAKDSLGTVSFSYLQHSLSWSQQVQQAVQHIYPRLAFSLSGSFRHAITKYEGRQFIGSGAIYLPGIITNHNLVLTGSFQEIDTLGQLTFGNRFAYSRGYTGRYFTRMWRMSANYHLPLLHADWGFGNLLYFQRIRANLFYDFTKVYSRNKTQTRDQRSAGVEVYFDTKWWNQYELTFGFRVSRLLDRDQFDGFKGNIFEFIMPVSIFPK